MRPELVGWAAAAVLLVTMVSQVIKQWRSGVSTGVSKWLFVGQTLASLGFVVYSYMQEDQVFLWVNSFMLANAAVGQAVVMRNRRRQRKEPPGSAGASPEAA